MILSGKTLVMANSHWRVLTQFRLRLTLLSYKFLAYYQVHHLHGMIQRQPVAELLYEVIVFGITFDIFLGTEQ
jgi:hypothetical protein